MKKVVYTPTSEISLGNLDSEARRKVDAWFDYLARWDEDQFVRDNAVPLPGHHGVRVLRTSTDIRIFFRVENDTITVLDVATLSAIMTSGGMGIGGTKTNVPVTSGTPKDS